MTMWPASETVAHEDLLASAEEYASRQGRVVRARTFGGWDVEILPDRGLDIGLALHDGMPVSWLSPARDRRPLDRPRDMDWLARFHGGLVTTCGLRGFGSPGGDRGLHGDVGHLPAGPVTIARTVSADAVKLTLSGVVEDARVFDASLRLKRTITLRSSKAGESSIELTDDLQNLGPVEAEIGVLFHVNLGAPLLVPGARVTVNADSAVHRGDTEMEGLAVYPEIASGIDEHVLERSGFPSRRGLATVSGAVGDLRLEWSADTLPYLVQWVFPARNRWALGLEPATSSLVNEDAPLARLAAGATRRHELRLSVARGLK